MSTWFLYLLFFLASAHCARSIFFVNVSLLDLSLYELGQERMPFQGRVAMIPILRWAHGNSLLGRVAAIFDQSLHSSPHMQHPPENYTPEKLACMLIGVIAVSTMTFASLWYGRRYLRELWWLPGVLTLAMLFTSYSARYEIPFWYPYDMPHFAIFGIACLLVLQDALVPAIILFVADVPLRETSIFLVPIVLAVGYSQNRLRRAVVAACCMTAIWLPVHLWIVHRFANNPNDTGMHWTRILILFVNPLHWPQLASAFGFLAFPLYLGRRYLARNQQFLLLGTLPCLLTTLVFGVWYETRIWDEWIVPAAALLATAFAGRFCPQEISKDLSPQQTSTIATETLTI